MTGDDCDNPKALVPPEEDEVEELRETLAASTLISTPFSSHHGWIRERSSS